MMDRKGMNTDWREGGEEEGIVGKETVIRI